MLLTNAALTAAERETLESVTRLLLAEKNWEGIGDIEVTQRMQVTVAAQAAVLVLERDYDDYAHVESILLYPAVYSTPQRTIEPGLVVTESWYRPKEQLRRGEPSHWIGLIRKQAGCGKRRAQCRFP